MKQAQKRVTLQMDKDRDVARQLVADGKKERALLLLRRKKRMEKSLMDLDGKLEVLEKMVADIEFSQIELRLIDGLKTGNEALKQLNQLLKVEDVHAILQETKESAEQQKVRRVWWCRSLTRACLPSQEIADLLSQDEFSAEEDADLEAELLRLTGDQVQTQLPNVPQHELPAHEAVQAVEEREEAGEERRRPQARPQRTAMVAE